MDRRERDADLNTAFLAAMQGAQSEIWTALPAVVVSALNVAKRTVSVQPTLRAKAQNKDGSFDWVDLPVLPDVPVFFPSGGGCTLTFPVKAGDECLVVFASRCIDSWWQSGGMQNQADQRMHDLSDAIAFVGISSVPKVIPSINANGAELRTDDGAAVIHVDSTTKNITVVGPNVVSVTAPEITLTGHVTVNGNINVNGGVGTTQAIFSALGISTSGDVVASGKSLVSHVHSGVTPGGSNTGAPV